jgi:beta-glucosidase
LAVLCLSLPRWTSAATDSTSLEQRIADLLGRMTLEEKIGQMTQIENNSLTPDIVTQYFLGSVLSGGGGAPAQDPSALGWAEMVDAFQQAALATRLGIPLLYGVDAIHGFGSLYGATLFPHNIGLGATRDPELVKRVARATAEEMLAANIRWNFGPVVAVPHDIRWGRTYEGFSENTQLVSQLGTAYLEGLQESLPGRSDLAVLATPKHYLGDGGTAWGSSTQSAMGHNYLLDSGDMQVDEATWRELFLPPYQAAVNAGAESVMASFSSWNGVKMSANPYLLTDVLKKELGFRGFVVSDWGALYQLEGEPTDQIVTAINAGVDMVMVPYDYAGFTQALAAAVKRGDVSTMRIDDAVRRILRAKFKLGLFEQPFVDPAYQQTVGSDAHRELAREAVRKSLVLLKNENDALPLEKETPSILLAGMAVDDIGVQSGGWTMGWQGSAGDIQPGTTILEAVRQAASPDTEVIYTRLWDFNKYQADVGLVILSEQPYAEGVGDTDDLRLAEAEIVDLVRPQVKKLVVVLLTGRPVEVADWLPAVDALVAAWWPGTEGQGVTDLLFGAYPFTGKLPYTWPRWTSQLPFGCTKLSTGDCQVPLFPYGYGLSTSVVFP